MNKPYADTAEGINTFLDKGYKVESSYGHVRDLPEKKIGVDVSDNFQPSYVIPVKAKKNVVKLKELARQAEKVVLATDEDREGEAIAWHLAEALALKKKSTERIVFHEITKGAISEALANPRSIDMKLVDAQQARRVLDRLVGYELSPFLWKKVAKGLSAGRVQSVAVRLVVEREREIEAFQPEEYWTIEVELSRRDEDLISEDQAKKTFLAKLHKINERPVEQLEIKNQAAAEKIVGELAGAKYVVAAVDRKQAKKNPPSPFTTSTLQQAANRLLGFSAKQTMVVAQQLYETGLITYMRTDSLFLADKFLAEARAYLHAELGEKYALVQPRRFKTKSKNAQEAHEAVRPADVRQAPAALKNSLNNTQYRLYSLIWNRSLATQMPSAILDSTVIDIDAKTTPYQFRATGQVLRFDGYLRIYPEKSKEVELPLVRPDEPLEFHQLHARDHATKPPARYSDAGLVKVLERYGIGRPSTYAPTIATIEARNYVARDENKKLKPTDIALVVNDLLVAHFPSIVDYQFTAQMESDLDRIADGAIDWPPVIRGFYEPWRANLDNKYNEINKKDIMPEEKSKEICDKCGAPMIIKTGRYGKFLACSAYPNCKNIKGLNGQNQNGEKSEELKKLEEKYRGEICAKCGAAMAVKTGKFGPFLACTAYPKCKNIVNIKENSHSTGVKCPSCGEGEIVEKRSRRGIFYACNRYPECKNAYNGKPTGNKCPQCGALLLEGKDGAVKCSDKDCGYVK